MAELTGFEVQRRIEKRELAELMKQTPFRKYLWRVLRDAGIWDTISCGDPLQTAFTEGSRALGLNLLRDAEAASPGVPAAILAEHGIPAISKFKPPEDPNGRDSDPDS